MRTLFFVGWLIVAGFVAGCSHVLPPEALGLIEPGLDLVQVRENPSAYVGKTLLLGGKIVKTEAEQSGTVFEVLSYSVNRWGEPQEPDETAGRFLAKAQGFYDPDIYQPGRFLTMTATVVGEEFRPLKDYQYHYPVLRIDSLYLWPKGYDPEYFYDYRGYYNYPPWPGYYPYGPSWRYDPYWGPYDPFWHRYPYW